MPVSLTPSPAAAIAAPIASSPRFVEAPSSAGTQLLYPSYPSRPAESKPGDALALASIRTTKTESMRDAYEAKVLSDKVYLKEFRQFSVYQLPSISQERLRYFNEATRSERQHLIVAKSPDKSLIGAVIIKPFVYGYSPGQIDVGETQDAWLSDLVADTCKVGPREEGLKQQLLKAAERQAQQSGFHRIVLTATPTERPFFQANGYQDAESVLGEQYPQALRQRLIFEPENQFLMRYLG